MGNTSLDTDVRPRLASPVGHDVPPVVILNLSYTGLGIARDMAGRGMRVIALSANRNTCGNSTRYGEVRYCPSSLDRPEELLQYLLQSSPELEGAVIFPTSDADVLFLDRFRETLDVHYRLAVPARRVLLRSTEKDALVEAAISARVPVPRTLKIETAAELELVPEEIGFPCVVKPVSSSHWRGAANWALVGGRKAFRAESLQQLRDEYARLSRVRPELLIQEWIPGGIDQLVVWGGYVGHNSEPLAYFTARKLLQAPEDCGTGCVVQSEDIPELVAPTRRLFKSLGYEGMAEVEYKRDPRDGTFKLIEINTRHWDWHRLARATGINLSWVAYRHVCGITVEPSHQPVGRMKWIAEDALILYIAESLYRGSLRLSTLWRHVSGRRMYAISSWRDPLPLLRCLFRDLLPFFIRTTLKKVREGVS